MASETETKYTWKDLVTMPMDTPCKFTLELTFNVNAAASFIKSIYFHGEVIVTRTENYMFEFTTDVYGPICMIRGKYCRISVNGIPSNGVLWMDFFIIDSYCVADDKPRGEYKICVIIHAS